MDLVLATLETKHDLNAAKIQHQHHPDRPGIPNQPWQDQGDGDGYQQQESSSSAGHVRGGGDLLDKKDYNILDDKVSQSEEEGVHSGSSGGRLHPVSLGDDTGLLTRNHVLDKQVAASAHSTSEERYSGANSSKRRLKRLLDSSSDEDQEK